MIDYIVNVIQISVLLICAVITLYRAVSRKSKDWTLLFFFFACWILSDLYWLLCLIFYEDSPQISVVPDLSWYATFLFLYLLLKQIATPDKSRGTGFLPWLGPIVAAVMAVFFMQWGEIISNVIYATVMGILMFLSIRRLQSKSRTGSDRFLPALNLIYCLLVYGLWLASCFYNDEAPFHPYYVFDSLLTVSFPFFLMATKKAVAE